MRFTLGAVFASRFGYVTPGFRTAIETSPVFGSDLTITGVHLVVSYTGKLQDGRMETLWFVVNGDEHWWRSTLTNHDTFTKLL